MRINVISPSTNSLNTIKDGKNVQGDELVARLWVKALQKNPNVGRASLNGKGIYDVSITFTPYIEPTSGYKILYMQNVFPKPAFAGTAQVFNLIKNRYNNYIFPSNGLKRATGEVKGHICQFATDMEVFCKRKENHRYSHNLCFVGNRIRKEETTEKYLTCVKDKGLVIYGNKYGWNTSVCKGKISLFDESVLYSSSKICLNAHLKEHLEYGTYNFRIFNILACGGFIISDHSEYLEKEFGECIVFTDGYDDLRDKVDYFLSHPEETIKYRMAGIKKVKESHTFDIRMNEMVKWLQEVL